jgi:glycosyltransferase involved in cell wall biosynthesis
MVFPIQISVVVPVFDEEPSLKLLHAQIAAALNPMQVAWELIFVDDRSSDGSLRVMLELQKSDPHVRAVAFRARSGQTAALAAGFDHARGDVVVTLDGDLQNDPADAPRLLAELERGFDVVSGVRQRRQDSWVRTVSSRIANGVRRRVLDDGITDVGCSLKAYRTRVVKRLPPFHGMHRFLPALARMEGARITEMPVAHRARRFGKSKYNISNRLWRGIADLLGVWWLKRRWVAVGAVEEVSSCTSTASGPSSASPDRPSSSAASSSSGSPPSAPSGA